MDLGCELNKPLCKRKLSMMEGPFQKPKRCPLSDNTTTCPLAPPKCPLLPQEKENNDCPVNMVVGNKNSKLCPLAQPACPCDPAPPCPLAYQEVNEDKKSAKKKKVICPSTFPTYGSCPEAVGKKDVSATKSPCSNVLRRELKKAKKSYSEEDETDSSQQENKIKPKQRVRTRRRLKKKNLKSKDGTQVLIKKNLTVPDCNLASRRPLPCSMCLGDLLGNTEKLLNAKDCPYLKLIDYCEDTCLCENLASIDTGPQCPFAPKPCPCCAVPRCPLSRQTNCPVVSKQDAKIIQPPSCKCYCPIIPPPCSLTIPLGCQMHNRDNSPRCKCGSESKKCPLVLSLYTTCPLQPNYQNVPCSEYKPEPAPFPPKKPQLPNLLVPPNVFSSIDSILDELNKMCTCDTPPPPQMVNMIPTTSIPSRSNQPPFCIATEVHDECPIECPCEPPRTFHVPTCPKKNPACLRSGPKSNEKGGMVCPFSPRCCPLGSVCPFPVAATALATTNEYREQTKKVNSSSSKNKEIDSIKLVPENEYQKKRLKTDKEDEILTEKIGNGGDNQNNILTNNNTPVSKCPLSRMADGKKKICPFAPAPCPLDPVKPLSIKEPKVCPFAPEPLCPLVPKPICPPIPNCLMKPSAPLPECPYAPPGCPLAPKKVCFPDSPMNYDCPCPKPKRCSCPDPGPNCPCPEADPSCPCPPVNETSLDSSCPCPQLQAGCPCPDPNSKCPCPKPNSGCPCPNLDSNCPRPPPSFACPLADSSPNCPCPSENQNCLSPSSIQCPLIPKPKYPLAPKFDPNCPIAVEKATNDDPQLVSVAKSNGNGSFPPRIRAGCPCPTQNSTGFPCPSQDGNSCDCPPQDGAKCPCPMLSNQCSCCPCDQPTTTTTDYVVDTVIEKLKSKPKNLDCAVKTPACEKFPEGRCPMEDLNLCNCDYPCPPCMEPAQCGSTEAPPQYCINPVCCMGLSLPPVTSDDLRFTDIEQRNKPINYYKFVQTKPGREETKFQVEVLDHPPFNPFSEPRERQNPNWSVIRYGSAFEKCDKIAEKLKKRKPCVDANTQFDPRDNPMEPEIKALMESIKNEERLEKEKLFVV